MQTKKVYRKDENGKPMAYWWLPWTTSYGENISCNNCKRYAECGKDGCLCGSWEEAKDIQIGMELKDE